jgi:hypothetical protein
MKPNHTLGFQEVNRFLSGLFDGNLHAKRVLSLANATFGVVRTAPYWRLIRLVRDWTLARGLVTKHAIKQGLRVTNSPLSSAIRPLNSPAVWGDYYAD